jgi:hypothetical protein
VKLLFDKSGELVVWSEGESVTLSVNGTDYEIDGRDLLFFLEFVKASVNRIELEKERKTPFIQKLKKLWVATD